MASTTYSSTVERPAQVHQLKFLVSPGGDDQIGEWVRSRIAAGSLQSERETAGDVHTLYFDTPTFDAFRKRGSFRRSRYRIRRYGTGRDAILERKTRRRRRVSKRESAVELGSLDLLAARESTGEWEGFWFHRRLLLRGLVPVCQVSCQRTEWILRIEGKPVRLTIDRDVRTIPARSIVFDDSGPGVPLLDGQTIVKLDYRDHVPALFKGLIEEFALSAKSTSKYRVAVKALGIAPEERKPCVEKPREPASCLTY